jgi:ribosomal protein S18 acetylase RimI-like enzyme
MINLDLRTRPATPDDQQRVANLIYFEQYVHRHLDWRAPLDWLGSPFFWVAESNGQVSAALACPPDPENIAWLRLFVCNGRTPPPAEAWHALWDAARTELRHHPHLQVGVICLQDWMEPLLRASGFRIYQEIVMLECRSLQPQPVSLHDDLQLHPMRAADLPQVAALDAASFEPLWHNSLDALKLAFPQALTPTVVQTIQGEIVAYQLATGNPFGSHLARLAVHPNYQRRGIARAILNHLLANLKNLNTQRVTVNTQSDNAASLGLYASAGFTHTYEHYPVFLFSE